jgi:hypothetical protein
MHEFENSAKRSEVRPRYDLIPFEALIGLADRFTIGLKYGEDNWKSGGPDFFKDAKNHLIHHLWCWLDGRLEDEKSPTDHLKSVLWNASILLWWELKGKAQWEEKQNA